MSHMVLTPGRTVFQIGCVLALCAAFQPAAGHAADSTAASPPVVIGGFVDAYFNWNFDNPVTHTNQLRNFDVTENQFALSMAEIAVTRSATPVGFRLDADFGPTNDLVQASGATGAPWTEAEIGQAYITYVAPVGAGLTIDAGKFATHIGFEVIKAKDNYNYSRSLLFALPIPYNHIGVRATYPVSSMLTLGGFIYNNLTGLTSVNSGKSFGFQAIVAPTSSVTIIGNWLGGPDQSNSVSKKFRNIVELNAAYQATPALLVAADWVYGQEPAPAGPALAVWRGLAGYARLTVCEPSALTLRGEVYDDAAGFTTGTRQKLYEGTLTYEYKGLSDLILRAEYRYDWADQLAYDSDTAPIARKNQATFCVGTIVVF
jgi:hypothetical protein